MLKKRLLPYVALAMISLGAHQFSLAQQSSSPSLQQRLGGIFSDTKEDELLEPDKAFGVKMTVKGPTTLVAELIPAKGYYLYKDRIRFSVKSPSGVTVKSVKLPNGKVTNDPTFGRTETYEYPVLAEITLERSSKVKNVTLVAGYQGCNKPTGVCYPPIEKTLNLTLP